MALIDFRNFLNTAKTAINTATPDGENAALGSKTDVGATAGDATPFSSIALLKGIFNKLAGILTVQVSGSNVQKAFAITPHDTNDLSHITIAIYVGTDGDLKVDLSGGETITLKNLASGVWHPICATRVYVTDTTAGSILGAY